MAHEIKLVVIGDAGVGKTSIVQRYVCGSFDPNTPATLGASFLTKTIEIPNSDRLVTFQIWDTAGQEKYRSLTALYYKEARAAILTYDTTSKKSFDDLKEWVSNVKDNAPEGIMLGVAANKSDLIDQQEVDLKDLMNFCKENNAIYSLTSAKENTGIDDLFWKLSLKVIPQLQEEHSILEKERELNKQKSVKLNKNKNQKRKNCC